MRRACSAFTSLTRRDDRVKATAMDLFEFRPIVCPTCGVDETRALGVRGGAAHRSRAGVACTVVECERCGLLYANPFPFPRDLDALYSGTEDYFGAHDDQNPAGFVLALDMVGRMTPGRRLLDVGAGRGGMVEAALGRGWDAWGIESASGFAAAADERCPGRVVHGLLEDAPASLVAEPYDVVMLAAVLEHLHHPTRVLGEIARVLKPGGVLYVEVPNEGGLFYLAGNLWERLRGTPAVAHMSPTFSPYHVFGFTPRSLTAMLRGQGLEPEEWHFYSGVSQLTRRPSLRGALEWAGSKAIHSSSIGRLGNTMIALSRRTSAAV